MAAHPTSSFRAPAEHHALVRSVASAVTRNPNLADSIARLLDLESAGRTAELITRADQATIEGRVAALEEAVAKLVGPPAAAPVEADASPAWITGEPKKRRMTPAGVAECCRRLMAGEKPSAVAAALGVTAPSVHQRLKRIDPNLIHRPPGDVTPW